MALVAIIVFQLSIRQKDEVFLVGEVIASSTGNDVWFQFPVALDHSVQVLADGLDQRVGVDRIVRFAGVVTEAEFNRSLRVGKAVDHEVIAHPTVLGESHRVVLAFVIAVQRLSSDFKLMLALIVEQT